jgi:RND family efflux transporter MFP subunit
VRARVDGVLDSIHFRDGAVVTPGQLLFVIDPRPYEARLDGARADVVRAQTRVELTTTDLARAESLFAIRGISQEEFDQRTQARKEAEAALIVARAAERSAALNVEFTRVRAPIGGRISEKFVSVGNVVSGGQAGSTLLTTIVAIDPMHFIFDASEADYLRYNRLNASGSRRTSRETPNPVRIRLLDETAFTHVGHMDFVDNRLDTTTGTIRGRALVANPGGSSPLGSSGDCSCWDRANSMRCSYRTAPSRPISLDDSCGPSPRRTCRNSASSSPAGSNAVCESCARGSNEAIGS